jgi:hypothetical protein
MLPEEWVRVSGLPSDVRSDYLTLWGVGTLFGKTLDVDMAYTRKNKVLRTKIGCLDHRLIPADSDMFIRRGFYKLRFEVEIEDQSQEVNMVDADNGSDGNNGGNHGKGKSGEAHDMDTDHKEKDSDEPTKDADQDGLSSQNGAEGMEKRCDFVEDIQFGTIDVNCTSPGNLNTAKNLNQIDLVSISNYQSEISAQNDKACAVSHADLLPRKAVSVSVGVGIAALSQ